MLFTPFRLKSLELPNRFVMPGMQRGMCEEGRPKPELADYYARRAQGGCSLIIGESAAVDHPSATAQPTASKINADTADGWKLCIDKVGEAGGAMFLQLWHEGAMRTDGGALSASGLAFPGKESGREATLDELAEIRDAFVRSALIAQEIGAAGVEVHAAHGYFLDQFLWAGSNRRDDGYGGDNIAHRARFPAEIIKAIRAACGEDFIISVRFSQWKEADYGARIAQSPAELEVMTRMFADAGADILHASNRRFWEPEWEGDPRNLAGWVREVSGLPSITVGSVGLDTDVMDTFTQEAEPGARVAEAIVDLEQRLEAGEFDLVAVGRAQIGDPDFVRKIEAGDYDAVRTFQRADLGQLEWDMSLVEEAHEAT